MNIHILDKAEEDLVEGVEFYEAQQSGLGSYFRDSLYSDIDSLRLYAGIHRVAHGSYHRALSKRFPFAIYYNVSDDTVLVHAVLDCRRDPTWIRKRLEEE
ncbi:MAG: type II toxin-antitoxin system RelE/ParE family toxin [Verrucomicrobia bacterium]|nr:type II toxin-antitoxin system RelE/ParE family toxin [Verrucomicrobiota bacterium]